MLAKLMHIHGQRKLGFCLYEEWASSECHPAIELRPFALLHRANTLRMLLNFFLPLLPLSYPF